MAVKRSVVVDPGTVLTKGVHRKKSRKHPGKQVVPSHPDTAHEMRLSPVEIGASPCATLGFERHETSREVPTGRAMAS